ncbi:MFS transporter [Streptomyces sp. NBC_01089]|uniref:MFS transporter n=1 Tax=Streptomyces sp. NBC_01089 TaxID=2903747 RepID=UPI0038666888|nr:MFS transporter [Streptomyces sp. NBC_01089]
MPEAAETTDPPQDMHAGVQRRTVRTLVVAEVISGSGIATGASVTSLLAEKLGGSATLAGLANTATTLGGAFAAAGIAAITHVHGRRLGLSTGYLAAAIGSALCIVAAVTRSFPLFLFGMLLYGAAGASGLQARFAAADLATPRSRGKAMSLVLSTTVVGAIVGPNLTGPGASLAQSFGLPALSGTYLFALAGFGLAFAAVTVWLRPDPLLLARAQVKDSGSGEREKSPPLRDMLRALGDNGPAKLAILSIVSAHIVMIALMTMTGIHMHHSGTGLGIIGMVLSFHFVGMFGFSTVFGWAVDRFGTRRLLLGGMGTMLLSLWISGTADGRGTVQLAVGLALLGLGWSAVLVAASVLLSESVAVDERPAAQGLSDMAMNFAAAGGAAVSGIILDHLGFGALAAIAAAMLMLPLLALPALRGRTSRSSADGAS